MGISVILNSKFYVISYESKPDLPRGRFFACIKLTLPIQKPKRALWFLNLQIEKNYFAATATTFTILREGGEPSKRSLRLSENLTTPSRSEKSVSSEPFLTPSPG